MVDLEILQKRGITPESLREKLSVDPLALPDSTDDQKKIKALIHRIRSRVQEGMTRNFQDFRVYHALDVAWDTPFRQISPTLLQSFLDRKPNTEEVYAQIESWGLTHLIQEKADPKTGTPIKTFDFPTFFHVFVPLVRAYVTIRWAKIMNDRRLTPFFKYEPVHMTTELGMKCEVLNGRVETMNNQYGYYEVTKQAVLKMLHYSMALQFPKEEWHFEEQIRQANQEDVDLGMTKPGNGEERIAVQVGDEVRVTSREGLRYYLPHPTRMYRDLAHAPWTYNYDSGCEYGGYWRIARYREIHSSTFWNTDKIPIGTVDMVSGNRLFFTTVYSACTLTIPTHTPPKQPEGPTLAASVGLGAGDLDREKEIATLYYGTEHGDQGVLVTEHFEKLIPKDNGLGDYDCPVWFRFVLAGDMCTILYAAPLPYTPIIYYGYDADESRSKNASMSLEIMPFQDQFSNVLTQMLLTAKQNLANLTFVDEDQVTPGALEKLKNLGERYFRSLNIMGFSSKKAAKFQNRMAEAVQSVNIPKGSVQELSMVLRQILDILERVLVMSSNEVGQAATHEQTREEVRNIAASTSSRLTFTTTPVDIAEWAWKRQIYEGLMAYGDEYFVGHLPSDIPLTDEVLTKMGFTFIDKQNIPSGNTRRYRRVRIKKGQTALPIWELASSRDNEDRSKDAQTAQVMSTLLQQMMGNPITAQAITGAQALEWANKIGQLAGIPRDFKLKDLTPVASPEQQQQQAQEQLKQVVDAVLAQVDQKLQGDLKPLLDKVTEQGTEIGLIFKALGLGAPQLQTPQLNGPDNINSPPPAGPGQAGAPSVPAEQGVQAPA